MEVPWLHSVTFLCSHVTWMVPSSQRLSSPSHKLCGCQGACGVVSAGAEEQMSSEKSFQYCPFLPVVSQFKACSPLKRKGSFSVLTLSPEGEWSFITQNIHWGPVGSEIGAIFIEKNLVPKEIRQTAREEVV